MNMIYLMVIGLFFAIVSGLSQGIIMHKPNLRDHAWFRFYHRIVRSLEPLSAMLFGAALAQYNLWRWANIAYFIGMFIVGWELFEVMYSYMRYWKLFPEEEDVLGLGYYVRGTDLDVLHFVRTWAGLLLLSCGIGLGL